MSLLSSLGSLVSGASAGGPTGAAWANAVAGRALTPAQVASARAWALAEVQASVNAVVAAVQAGTPVGQGYYWSNPILMPAAWGGQVHLWSDGTGIADIPDLNFGAAWDRAFAKSGGVLLVKNIDVQPKPGPGFLSEVSGVLGTLAPIASLVPGIGTAVGAGLQAGAVAAGIAGKVG